MKLSFSLPPKSKSRVRSVSNSSKDEVNLKVFVTEFDPSETLTDAKPSYVIPPLQDRWRPHKVIKNIEFEPEIPSKGSDKITYGLNLRKKVVEDKPSSKPEPVEQMLLKIMRKDLESLPDAPELEDFESVPVEGFGSALLAGYGWKPGQGIGLNAAKQDVKIVEYKKWIDNQGLGFNPGMKSKERARKITIRDVSFKGKNVEQLDSGSSEIEHVEKYRKVSRHESRTSKKQNDKSKKKTSWLRSHIRVRIISKDVKGGRLYLKKAVVADVVGPTTCDITMDETHELVQGIDQELLETALPRRGGPVLVLSGRHKGVYGSLVEKDLNKETGVLCEADSKEMLDVKLEQVAEYVGDPGDIGY